MCWPSLSVCPSSGTIAVEGSPTMVATTDMSQPSPSEPVEVLESWLAASGDELTSNSIQFWSCITLRQVTDKEAPLASSSICSVVGGDILSWS
jgi:hypothetical protein